MLFKGNISLMIIFSILICYKLDCTRKFNEERRESPALVAYAREMHRLCSDYCANNLGTLNFLVISRILNYKQKTALSSRLYSLRSYLL